jgi:hypothetical protein
MGELHRSCSTLIEQLHCIAEHTGTKGTLEQAASAYQQAGVMAVLGTIGMTRLGGSSHSCSDVGQWQKPAIIALGGWLVSASGTKCRQP